MARSKSYKIAFVLDDGLDKPDGVQQYILALGNWLTSAGHEVHYIVGQTARTDITNVHSVSRNIRAQSNGNQMTIPLPTRRRKLRALLEQENFDILHIQVPYSPFMSHRLIRLAPSNTAIFGTFHIAPDGWLTSFGTRLLGIWLRTTLKRFDKMYAVSGTARIFAKDTFRVNAEVLPNVIDYARFHNAIPLKQYSANSTRTILFLGRLVPRKGTLVLLKAVKRLASTGQAAPFRVLVCGKGPLQGKLEQYIAEHQLEEYVQMVGFVSEADKPRYYASADIAVFPSSGGESFGIVLLEAMASGKAAVLAGDNPGYRSVLSTNPQLLFEPKNDIHLAGLLHEYLNNDRKRATTAKWGEQFTKQFDTAVVGRQLLKDYRTVLQRKKHL